LLPQSFPVPDDVVRRSLEEAAVRVAQMNNKPWIDGSGRRSTYLVMMGKLDSYEMTNDYSRTVNGDVHYFGDFKVKFSGGQAHTFWNINDISINFTKRGQSWYWELSD